MGRPPGSSGSRPPPFPPGPRIRRPARAEEEILSRRWSDDTKAEEEYRLFIEEKALQGTLAVILDRIVKTVGKLIIFFILLFSTIFSVMLVAVVWHYVAPKEWLWLEEESVQQIQSVLFSGSVGALFWATLGKFVNEFSAIYGSRRK